MPFNSYGYEISIEDLFKYEFNRAVVSVICSSAGFANLKINLKSFILILNCIVATVLKADGLMTSSATYFESFI